MAKKIFIGLFVFLLLILTGLVVAPFLFKDKIIAAAHDAANQELNATINIGDFDVSILQNIKSFPDVSLIAKDVTIIGKDTFAKDTLLKVGKIAFALDIKSFFNSDATMKINGISISNAVINAIEKSEGLANWDILKKTEAKKEESKFSLSIKKIQLDHIDIYYRSVPSNQKLEIINFSHKGKGDFTQNNLEYNQSSEISSFTFYKGIIPYFKNLTVKNTSEIKIDQTSNTYSFQKNEIALNDLKVSLNGVVQNLSDGIMKLDLNFKSEQTNFKVVLSLVPAFYTNKFSDIKANGNFDLKGTVNGNYYKNNYPKMDIAFNVINADFQYPSLPKKVSNINIRSKILGTGGSADNIVVDVSQFNMNIGSDPFEGRLKMSNLSSNPYFELYSKGKLNLSDIKSFYPMEGVKTLTGLMNIDLEIKAKKSDITAKNYQAIHADGIASISGLNYESTTVEKPLKINSLLLKFSPQYVDMTECNGMIGKTDFKIKGRLENFIGYYLSKDEVMRGQVSFLSNHIDANEFLSDEKDKKSEYVLVPKGIDVNGSVDIKEMLYGKMQIRELVGALNVADEQVKLQNVKAILLGGSATMNATYSTKGIEKPISTVSYNVQNFDMKQVYDYMECAPKIAPILNYMTGSLSSESNLTMQLLPDMSPNLNTLNGDFSIDIPSTRIVNLPILNQVAQVTKLSQLSNLEINNIKTKLSFQNGRAIVQPFNFKANNLNLGIQGSQGLDKSLDYIMAVDVPFSQLGSAAGLVTGLVSKYKLPFLGNVNPETIRLNLNVKGFFDKPAVSLGKPEFLTGGKAASPEGAVGDAVKSNVDALKNQAAKTADSMRNAIQDEAHRKAEELRKQGEDKANELKKKAEDEVNSKKEDLLNELKKKLPW